VQRPAFLEVPAPQLQQREIVLRVGVIGREFQRAPIMRFLPLKPPLRANSRTHADVNLRIVAQGQGPAILRLRFHEFPKKPERRAEIHVRLEVVRPERQCSLQAGDRFLESLQFAQRVAFAEMCVEVARIPCERLAIYRQRFVVALRGRERRAEVQTRVDEIGISSEQRLVLFNGFVEAALLL
jgi:hypothetical protein